MKHKLSQNQSSVYESIFTNKTKQLNVSVVVPPTHENKPLMPIYHVEKINKMKFKVYKQGSGRQFIEKLPVAELSFQIKIKGNDEVPSPVKPRL